MHAYARIKTIVGIRALHAYALRAFSIHSIALFASVSDAVHLKLVLLLKAILVFRQSLLFPSKMSRFIWIRVFEF